MSDAPISDKEYQQARRKAILRRGMNQAVSKMHPGDIGLPDVPAFDGQGRIDGGRLSDNTKQEIRDAWQAGLNPPAPRTYRPPDTPHSVSEPLFPISTSSPWHGGGLTERAQPAKLPTLNGS
jgi:hypothetical protein